MSKRHRLSLGRRWLLRGLVLFLVPVVLVATPHAATAATAVSGTTLVSFGYDNWVWGQWASCKVQAYYKTEGAPTLFVQQVQWNSGDCDTGPGHDLQGGASLTLTFKGQTPAGESCEASDTVQFGTDEVIPNGAAVFSLAGSSVDTACTVSQMCWNIYESHWLPGKDAVNESGCESAAMGVPEPPAPDMAGCPVFNFDHAVLRFEDGEAVGGAYYWWLEIYGLETVEGQMDSDWTFGASWVWNDYSLEGVGPPWRVGMPELGSQIVIPNPATGQTMVTTPRYTTSAVGWADLNQFEVEGVQIRALKAPPTNLTGMQLNDDGGYVQPGDANSLLGLSRPSECLWYVGDAVVDIPGTEDVPGKLTRGCDAITVSRFPQLAQPGENCSGDTAPPADDPDPDTTPVPTPDPVDTDEGCTEGFSLWNPTSWASAGFCEVVSGLSTVAKTLGRLIGTILKLPGLIVDAFSGFFDGLFVPDQGYLDNRVDSLRDSLDDTTPGRYVDAFGDMQTTVMSNGPTGCEGVKVAPPMPGDDGVMFDMRLGAACEGQMATIAAMVRIGISAAVVIGGGLACVRAIGSGLGWSPSVGRGGEPL